MTSARRKQIATQLRKVGPYALAALLPGGSIVALLLWLQQRRHKEI
jgi:hypothetical protein